MSGNSRDVAVVGGGVIGAACAHFLNKLDYNVTVFDRSDFGSQCSHGNCGKICPSHALPLAEPGVIAQVARSVFGGNTPRHIQRRLPHDLVSRSSRLRISRI